jgi:hypothetical protein
MKLAFGRSLERTFVAVITSIAGLVCFMVVDLTGEGKELTNAKIFATLDLLGTIKVAALILGTSIGFYF